MLKNLVRVVFVSAIAISYLSEEHNVSVLEMLGKNKCPTYDRNASSGCPSENNDFLRESVQSLASKLDAGYPANAGQNLRIESATSEGTSIIFALTALDEERRKILEKIADYKKPLSEKLCRVKDSRELLMKGVIFIYRYYDLAGDSIDNIVVTAQSCEDRKVSVYQDAVEAVVTPWLSRVVRSKT